MCCFFVNNLTKWQGYTLPADKKRYFFEETPLPVDKKHYFLGETYLPVDKMHHCFGETDLAVGREHNFHARWPFFSTRSNLPWHNALILHRKPYKVTALYPQTRVLALTATTFMPKTRVLGYNVHTFIPYLIVLGCNCRAVIAFLNVLGCEWCKGITFFAPISNISWQLDWKNQQKTWNDTSLMSSKSPNCAHQGVK